MEEFLNNQFYGNSVSNWFISLGIIVGAIVIGKLVTWFTNKILKQLTSKSKSRLDDILIDMLEQPVVFAIAIAGIWAGLERLHFSNSLDGWLGKIYHILIVINITWFVARFIDAVIKEYLIPFAEKSEGALDNQVLPIVQKVFRAVIWSVGLIVALNNAGYDVGALIAGLGIGGLALAMAAKETVSNMFGGVMVFTIKSFKIGDRIKINGFDGFVSEISFQVTRLRTLEGRLVTIPNSLFIGNIVENVTAEPTRKITLNLGLVYETTPQEMQKAMDILKDISEKSSNLDEGTVISFTTFGDFNLGITFIYFIKKESDIFLTQSEISLEILKRFNENNLSFAFPTQTIYSKSLN
ncbi:MAG: mechanosensitive ion channel family protein [Flavobacteriales bacterium]|nr:mechanosensitive ion channel family protein [Flavobacteriales bacterium]MBX2960445.1 mechanosensitive ion channel family protein [Flavobacteriales bacterium]HRN42798.1 mechanosensitive ion channel family protein [Vicingus sp.]